MTEEEMDKFADIVSEKVINKIKKNQEEWDKQFQEEMQDMEAGFYEAKKLTDKDKLKEEIQELVTLKADCIESERYELIPDIEKKLAKAIKKYLL
jgi:polyhydroxyalkanoate synthesis regulator phasin